MRHILTGAAIAAPALARSRAIVEALRTVYHDESRVRELTGR